MFEEVLVDFKCDWSRIIENHLDILHLFWVHGDTIPDKDVNKNVLVSFNQRIKVLLSTLKVFITTRTNLQKNLSG